MMLVQDCAKNDLQAISAFTVAKPAVYVMPALSPSAVKPLEGLAAQGRNSARGPPPVEPQILKPAPLLLTLRFRP
jgi:hypothetical protein